MSDYESDYEGSEIAQEHSSEENEASFSESESSVGERPWEEEEDEDEEDEDDESSSSEEDEEEEPPSRGRRRARYDPFAEDRAEEQRHEMMAEDLGPENPPTSGGGEGGGISPGQWDAFKSAFRTLLYHGWPVFMNVFMNLPIVEEICGFINMKKTAGRDGICNAEAQEHLDLVMRGCHFRQSPKITWNKRPLMTKCFLCCSPHQCDSILYITDYKAELMGVEKLLMKLSGQGKTAQNVGS
jgi:hypothetical protein